jgi:hypothetical protein
MNVARCPLQAVGIPIESQMKCIEKACASTSPKKRECHREIPGNQPNKRERRVKLVGSTDFLPVRTYYRDAGAGVRGVGP